MKKLLFVALLLLSVSAVHAQQRTKLPTADLNFISKPLGNALLQRRSYREFDASKAISELQLSTLLWAACGISDEASGKITAPSAVNMQDIKVYVCTADGVSLYDAKTNTLIGVSGKDIRQALAAQQQNMKDAPLFLLLVSDQDNVQRKNERWGLMDSGYVSQNIYLACTAMGLHTVARAMMDEKAVRQQLGLSETVLVLLNHPVGYGK